MPIAIYVQSAVFPKAIPRNRNESGTGSFGERRLTQRSSGPLALSTVALRRVEKATSRRKECWCEKCALLSRLMN
uniref:Uncharacterized protein n=1 Tax=Steinernema glaseri TaxID=37863 RepID=A0A1I8AKM1_9BILA